MRTLTTPHPYQIRGVQMIQKFGGRVILADVMGLGKTLQALLWVKTFLKAPGKVVIVCPASLKWNWKKEASQHLNMRVEVLSGKTPPPGATLGGNGIWVINYDVLGTSVRKNTWLKALLNSPTACVIADEAHMLKTRTAKRTKAVGLLCKGVPHVLLLTGTPMTNEVAEVFPLANLVCPEHFPSFVPFAVEYCVPERKPWGWVYKGSRNPKKLHRLLTDTCLIRRLKSDVLKELPPKVRAVVPLELSDEGEYRKAETDFLNWLKLTHPKKASGARRAEGLVRVGYLRRLVGDLKLMAVQHWTGNYLASGEKLILFGVHKAVLKPTHAHFGNASVLVDGSVKGEDRQKAFDRFQTDPTCRLFLGNLQAAGTGWNGTAAAGVAFAEFDWTPASHAQAADRAHRIGQTRQVTEYWLVARNTVEEYVAAVLHEKQMRIDAGLDDVQSGDDGDVFDQLEQRLLKRGDLK